MADRNTNWERERDYDRGYDRNDWREDAWRRGPEFEGAGDRFRERGGYSGYDRRDEPQRDRYIPRGEYGPRGDYGPGAFNHGAGQDNELYGAGSRGYGSTWGGSGVYREGQNLYRGQLGYSAYEGQHSGKGPKGYARSDDRIREDVCECLTRHGYIDASEIEVRVKDGEVTLAGTVNRRGEKRMAEEAADLVPGVRDVHNQLRTAGINQNINQNQMQQEHNMEPVGAGTRRR